MHTHRYIYIYRQTDTLYMYIYITTNIFCREYSCPNYFIYKYSYIITVYLTKAPTKTIYKIHFFFFLIIKKNNHKHTTTTNLANQANLWQTSKQQQKMCCCANNTAGLRAGLSGFQIIIASPKFTKARWI